MGYFAICHYFVYRKSSRISECSKKRKLFTPRKVQLLTMAGLNIIKYAQSVRSDQLLVVCATDKTSKDCGQAVITLKEYLSASLNEVLVQRQLCASDVDVAKLTDELDTQIVLAECLTDKTLPKKFGFNLFPMFLFLRWAACVPRKPIQQRCVQSS